MFARCLCSNYKSATSLLIKITRTRHWWRSLLTFPFPYGCMVGAPFIQSWKRHPGRGMNGMGGTGRLVHNPSVNPWCWFVLLQRWREPRAGGGNQSSQIRDFEGDLHLWNPLVQGQGSKHWTWLEEVGWNRQISLFELKRLLKSSTSWADKIRRKLQPWCKPQLQPFYPWYVLGTPPDKMCYYWNPNAFRKGLCVLTEAFKSTHDENNSGCASKPA